MTVPTTTVAAGGNTSGRPARPGSAAYWDRVCAIADAAPPLTTEQRCAIRLAIHGITRTHPEAAA